MGTKTTNKHTHTLFSLDHIAKTKTKINKMKNTIYYTNKSCTYIIVIAREYKRQMSKDIFFYSNCDEALNNKQQQKRPVQINGLFHFLFNCCGFFLLFLLFHSTLKS